MGTRLTFIYDPQGPPASPSQGPPAEAQLALVGRHWTGEVASSDGTAEHLEIDNLPLGRLECTVTTRGGDLKAEFGLDDRTIRDNIVVLVWGIPPRGVVIVGKLGQDTEPLATYKLERAQPYESA